MAPREAGEIGADRGSLVPAKRLCLSLANTPVKGIRLFGTQLMRLSRQCAHLGHCHGARTFPMNWQFTGAIRCRVHQAWLI